MAIPISALASTGASFTPSPTKASLPFLLDAFKSFSTSLTFPNGSNSEWTSSILTFSPTFSAVFLLSPVSITVFLTPAFFRFIKASTAFSLILSEITILPLNSPFIAQYTTVPIESTSLYKMLNSFINFEFPTSTSSLFITAFIPRPDISLYSFITSLSISLPYSFMIEIAIGWLEKLSAIAATSISFSLSMPLVFISATLNTPSVKVPVLSNTTVSKSFNSSK